MSQEPKTNRSGTDTRQAETCQTTHCLYGLSNGRCVHIEYSKTLRELGVPCFIPIDVVNEPDFDLGDYL